VIGIKSDHHWFIVITITQLGAKTGSQLQTIPNVDDHG